MKVAGMQEMCDFLLEVSKIFLYQRKGVAAMVQSFARSHP